MARADDTAARLAIWAFACGLLAFPCWLLSFSWMPFAFTGREVGSARYLILAGEGGALLAALLAIGLGAVARGRAPAGTAHRRRAGQGLAAGVIALILVIGLNVLGMVFA